MAEGSNQSQYTTAEISDDNRKETKTIKKKQKGILSRIWNRIFRDRNEDFEKRLQYLSKEEASVLARMKRRSQRGRKMARNIILLSVILEVIAVGYAIIITRSFDLDWKMRAVRVLPMFLLPGLSSIIYSTLVSFTRMRERKDQKTIERLRAERQAKIDELKERTNYYITQQLIQRYDPDPAAKAAAATVLASKLGLDSGLQVYLKEDTKVDQTSGKSKDFELAQSDGLRNRRPSHTSSKNARNHLQLQQSVQEGPNNTGSYGTKFQIHNQVIVVNHHPNSIAHDSGWIARIAALLVGEDPKQSYALICGNCHMHNGLARKEEFPFITYYCPHCHALNKSKQSEGNLSISNSCNVSSPETPSIGNILKNGPDISSRNVLTTSDEVSGNNIPASIVEKSVEEEQPS